MLRLDDRWIWDSWVADDGERYHLFFLQAPSSLLDAERRHTAATIGHASSTDLTEWRIEPDVLGPGDGTWDDLALWTGSVVRDGSGWRLFYTAISTRGHGVKDQRIGTAVSPDLIEWQREGDAPAVVADARWYKTLDEDPTASETWRDPFVLADPDGSGWHMLVTARAAGAPRLQDGVIAHATSDDLRRWTVQPPLGPPAGFGQIEVPQVRMVDGTWVLVFTCHPDEQSPAQVQRFGPHSTWSITAPGPLGPWHLDRARPLTADPFLFAAPLVQRRDGGWSLVGFRNVVAEGRDELWIVDPIAVRLVDGVLTGA